MLAHLAASKPKNIVAMKVTHAKFINPANNVGNNHLGKSLNQMEKDMGLDHKTVAQAKEFYETNTAVLDEVQQTNSRLREFARTVERAMRVKTVPRDRNTAWVYRDKDLMAIGYIGYGDFTTSVNGDNKFIVCARGIENMKYSEYGDQHNMRMALKMDTAMKHAKRYLVPYSLPECAGVFARQVKQEVSNVRVRVKDKYSETKRAVGINERTYGDDEKAANRLMSELRSMLQAGHSFIDKALDADIRAMFEAADGFKHFEEVVPMDFIHVHEQWGQQVVGRVTVNDVAAWRPEYKDVCTFRAEEVPEEIQHGCAALSMCEDGHFVEGVGYRVNDHTFYLYK